MERTLEPLERTLGRSNRMQDDKDKKNAGQQWMPGIQKDVEASFENRPKGMPALSVLKDEAKKFGLKPGDAEAIYDSWMINGFRTKIGKIKSWRHAFRNWYRNSWFPSQKKNPQLADADLERIRAKVRRMKGER